MSRQKKGITAKEIIGGSKKQKRLHFSGYDFTVGDQGTTVRRERIDLSSKQDYGADPLGDGTFRMVPSGDIVSYEERSRRLKR